MKKFLTLLMCFVLLMTSAMAVGCPQPGPGPNGEKTVIRVFHSNGGTGTQWLRNLEKRFEEDFADKEYATGKKGVDVKVSEDLGDNVDNIASDATDVFFLKRKSAVSLAIKGEVLDLTEWISEDSDVRNGEPISILDKMDEASIKKQSYGSGIYAIPTEFYLEGVSYDVEMFDNECLYIAAAGDTAYSTPYTAEEYVESLGEDATVRFINYDTAPKSLGPDGKPNTSDDGLPSSVSEWLVLCHYMKNVCGIAPMSVSGKYNPVYPARITNVYAVANGNAKYFYGLFSQSVYYTLTNVIFDTTKIIPTNDSVELEALGGCWSPTTLRSGGNTILISGFTNYGQDKYQRDIASHSAHASSGIATRFPKYDSLATLAAKYTVEDDAKTAYKTLTDTGLWEVQAYMDGETVVGYIPVWVGAQA